MTDTTSYPTPVQGEPLPVVAYELCPRFDEGDGYFDFMRNDGSAQKLIDKGWKVTPLTDHAQATAEIAWLQGEVERQRRDLDVWREAQPTAEEYAELYRLRAEVKGPCDVPWSVMAAQLRAENATLRTQLSDTTGQVGKLLEIIHSAKDAIYHHGTAPTLDEFDAALNSTAQESKT